MLLSRSALAGALVALAGAPASADDVAVPAVEATTPPTEPPRAPTGSFFIGAGYSPDDGPTMHAAVVQPDLFRTGQRLALTADLSRIRQRFALSWDVPNILPGLDLETELFATRRDFGPFTREGQGGQLGLSYKLDKHTRIYGRYRLEHVAVELATAGKPFGEIAKLGDGMIATLGAGLVHDTLDTRYLPRRGTRFELFADRADRRWGSDYNFERTGGSLDVARGLGPLTLRLHGHATYIRSRDPMGVPLSERLQHDGHAEVRGYALDSLPPLGSNLEAVGRVELELPLWSKAGLSLAGWADAGVRHDTEGLADPVLQRSLGASLIWRSPIGPLRFDVAFPLDGATRDRQFLFGLGGWW